MKNMVNESFNNLVNTDIPQHQMVREYLESGGSLTQDEAKELFGIGRLAVVIERLRHKIEPYMPIQTDMVSVRNRFGKTVEVGRYYIKK